MIILRNKSHGEFLMEYLRPLLGIKKYSQILNKKYLTLLPQCIACYLTTYYVEKNSFWRIIYF